MNTKIIEAFKNKLKDGFVLGPFSKTNDSAYIEIMGLAGFDFVIIDMEHGPVNTIAARELIMACELKGILPIIRVKENMPSLIGEVLDIGACGVQIPQITDAASAKEVIKLAKFHPAGNRGVCRYVRAADHSSMEKSEYFREANRALLILQLEGKQALDNIDEILEVEGIDIIFIGPYDLSQSLGVPGEVNHPLVISRMDEIVVKSRNKGIITGTFVETPADAKKWIGSGLRYICYSVDVGIFYSACRQINDSLKR